MSKRSVNLKCHINVNSFIVTIIGHSNCFHNWNHPAFSQVENESKVWDSECGPENRSFSVSWEFS